MVVAALRTRSRVWKEHGTPTLIALDTALSALFDPLLSDPEYQIVQRRAHGKPTYGRPCCHGVSHETALELHELSEVIPDAIHITVPRSRRWYQPPEGVRLHTTTRPPSPDEVVTREGMSVTAPARTIADAAEAGLAPEHVEKAMHHARRRGLRRIRSSSASEKPPPSPLSYPTTCGFASQYVI